MGLIHRLVAVLGQRFDLWRRERRTYRELNALSIDGLLDLDLYRGDLRRIARDSVRARKAA